MNELQRKEYVDTMQFEATIFFSHVILGIAWVSVMNKSVCRYYAVLSKAVLGESLA